MMRGNFTPVTGKDRMMQKINEVSFAVNDIHLYLDTHPCDEKAMEFFRENVRMRKEALSEYARMYGPLTIDTAADSASRSWQWIQQPFPGEKEGGCR